MNEMFDHCFLKQFRINENLPFLLLIFQEPLRHVTCTITLLFQLEVNVITMTFITCLKDHQEFDEYPSYQSFSIHVVCHNLDTCGLSLLGYKLLIITWIHLAYHHLDTRVLSFLGYK